MYYNVYYRITTRTLDSISYPHRFDNHVEELDCISIVKMKEVDKTYDRVIGGGLKLKGKLISKSKRNNKVPKLDQSSSSSVDSSVAQEGKDYLTIPIDKDYKKESSGDSEGLYARNPGQSKSDILKERIDRVKNNPNLTSSEKTFKIAQIKRTYQRIENSLKESHREKIEKFNSKLSKLSEHFDIPKVGPG